MASHKLGREQAADHMPPKEKLMKDASKSAVVSKSAKRHGHPVPSPAHPFLGMVSSSSIATAGVSSTLALSSVLSATTVSPMALLREILGKISSQRNQILTLMNSIDPSFATTTCPKTVQVQKLLNHVAELQVKILDVNDEICLVRAKNAQLEQQLCSFQGKRA